MTITAPRTTVRAIEKQNRGRREPSSAFFAGFRFTSGKKLRIIPKKEVGDVGIAFIQDKLEIKFLILYIVSRLTEPTCRT